MTGFDVDVLSADGPDMSDILVDSLFNDNIDEETLKEEGLIDEDYWSPNGDEIDEEDPDWDDDTKSKTRKTKKLRKTRNTHREINKDRRMLDGQINNWRDAGTSSS